MSHQHCLCCGEPLEKRGVCDFCLRLYRPEIKAEFNILNRENAQLKQEIAHARKELWMPDEEDETFLQGVEGVHFRIIGLLNEVKNLEYRLQQLEHTTPPAPLA